MTGIAKSILHEVEFLLEPWRLQILFVAVPANRDVLVAGDLHDLFHDGQPTGLLAMDLHANLLAKTSSELAQFIERPANWFTSPDDEEALSEHRKFIVRLLSGYKKVLGII